MSFFFNLQSSGSIKKTTKLESVAEQTVIGREDLMSFLCEIKKCFKCVQFEAEEEKKHKVKLALVFMLSLDTSLCLGIPAYELHL